MFWSKLFKKKGYKVKMPQKTTRGKTTNKTPIQVPLHEGAVREIVMTEIRLAVREQSREIEQHLNSIDERLRQLEKKK